MKSRFYVIQSVLSQLLLVLLIMLNFNCKNSPQEITIETVPTNNPLRTTVEFLCGIQPPRNYDNPDSMDRAALYLEKQLSRCTPHIEIQKFKADNGVAYKNVIAVFNPDGEERIIVGAHYDVCGNQPGADDNASAVAGLVEIGRLLAKYSPNLKYRVDLVAYALEEPPTFYSQYMGSYVHAKSIKDAGVKVKVMICLEMIGYFTDQPGSQSYPAAFLGNIYPDKGNFIGVIGKLGQGFIIGRVKKLMQKSSAIPVQSIAAPRALPGIDRSDHFNYWNFGYRAVMITDTADYRNPNYHMRSDTPDTLDYERMAEVVKGVYNAVVNL